ncbi:hypothetical protein [Limimaricola hongkongensis]|uniref:Uncharacterized protein n=1 Tax=Limimaricola hongkongensis DSM 17492 TaxID=1122180 RepID=A0A017H9U9_9RHOB|nr:hypothetical protein [Limimaricola hongkongensis]EYD71060.1 hypothetical protein Lokhon_02705 [Limimaricola hongkongensis DSM 17492]
MMPLRPIALSALLALCALAAAAQAPDTASVPLSAEEFAARVQGRTLTYQSGGAPYGKERYGPDRQVTWSFLDGRCLDGEWYPNAGAICFAYEDGTGPECWHFYEEGGRLSAAFVNDPEVPQLYETQDSDTPLFCQPEAGV